MLKAEGTRESSRQRRRNARRHRLAAALASLATLALALPATAAADSTAQHSCGWAARLSGDQLNVAFPDAAAKYWIARIPMPPGGHAEISGRFPHARYISFIDYTGQTQAIDGIADEQIKPDPGSSNPFVAGGDRTAAKRSYRVEIVSGNVPAKRAPNTIYTNNADGSKTSSPGSVLVIYRVYEPDRGLDIAGGVGLPSIAVVDASGQATPVPDCPDDSLPDTGLRQLLAQAGQSGGSTLPNTGLGSTDPPVWVRYTGAANGVATGALDNQVTGNNVYPPASQVTNSAPSGGFFENVHNAYMTSYYSAGFGAVLAYRAKAPSTPATVDGEPQMGSGQLRYWSFCTNNALTQYYDCVNDDAVAVDADGYYTVAVSTAANRPANAKTACGVTWLPAGPTPQSVVILRNMLPSAGFREAIQNAKQGSERATLGAYYPVGRYYAQPGDFAKLGCHPPARIGPAGASANGGSGNRGGARCARRASSVSVALRASRGRLPRTITLVLPGRRPRRIRVGAARVRVSLRGIHATRAVVKIAIIEHFARRDRDGDDPRTLRFTRTLRLCAKPPR